MSETENDFLGSFDEILYDIKSERKKFHFAQRCLGKKNPPSWEMFLILRVLGRVSYLTKGQMERFLKGWQNHFESDLSIRHLVPSMCRRNLIQQMSAPVTFTRGELKDCQVTPYYLTRTGKIILKYLTDLMRPVYRDTIESAIEHAETGEPKGEMFSRLKHEIMVSEVYIDLIERGNYVHWFKNENELRRDLHRGFWWRNRETIEARHHPESIPDFAVCYYDKEKKTQQSFEGEVAVKYTGRQISEKKDGLTWYCYNDSEAQKILHHTGQTATILTAGLLNEVRGNLKEKRSERSDVIFRNKILEDCMRIIGGVTVSIAAFLSDVSPQTVNPKLKKLSGASSISINLSSRKRAGRPRVLYFDERYLGKIEKQRELFLVNLAFEYLLKRNFKITLGKERVILSNEKEKAEYQILLDADPERSGGWDEKIVALERKIKEGKLRNLKTIFVARDYYNHLRCEFHFPEHRHIYLPNYFEPINSDGDTN